LLQDENLRVASLAMEQFLQLGRAADEAIAEHQEAQDPQLRHRIHQLSSIMARRRARVQFIEAVSREGISLWEGVLQINSLYDPQCNLAGVEEAIDEVVRRLRSGTVTTPRIAAAMRDQDFMVPEENLHDVDLYLVERVLETRYGSPAVLCALVHYIGSQLGWAFTIVLHAGRFCLIDRNNLILDPSERWHISRLGTLDKIHPCGQRDVLLGVLSQLFLVVLIEGQLRDLYHFGDLLTALNGSNIDGLPYPLGEGG